MAAAYTDYPELAYLMYPDQEFVLSTGERMTGIELFIAKYGKQQSQGSYQGYHTYSGALTQDQYDGLPARIKKYFTTYGTDNTLSKKNAKPKYIFVDTVENRTSIVKDVQTYYGDIYTPDFIKESKLPDYFKTQTSPTSIYNPANKKGVVAESATSSPSDASASPHTPHVYDKTSYPAEAPTTLPDPMSYDDFVSTYFPDGHAGITGAELHDEYDTYTQNFRNYVMSRTQYYDPESGTYKYRELPAWETVDMHRHLTTDDNGKPKASYAHSIAQPTEDYTTYIDTATGNAVEHPLRTRGEQKAQGWYITRDQLNNIIYDAENGAFKAPVPKASPSTSPTAAASTSTAPTVSVATMRADAFLDPTHADYQDVLALGQGPLTKEAATSWAQQHSSSTTRPTTRPTLADMAASFRPGNTRTPTLFDLRK